MKKYFKYYKFSAKVVITWKGKIKCPSYDEREEAEVTFRELVTVGDANIVITTSGEKAYKVLLKRAEDRVDRNVKWFQKNGHCSVGGWDERHERLDFKFHELEEPTIEITDLKIDTDYFNAPLQEALIDLTMAQIKEMFEWNKADRLQR